MKSPLKIVVAILVISSIAFGSENDSLLKIEPDIDLENKTARFSPDFGFPNPSEHSSLLSRDRFFQRSQIGFGFSSSGGDYLSVMNYTHGIDYIFGPRMNMNIEFELSRFSSKGVSQTELMPSLRLDWRPTNDMHIGLNLHLSPKKLAGDGIFVDPWHKPIDN